MDAQLKPQQTVPLVISGGGLVGALAALLLARARPQWQIHVLEPNEQGPAQDQRVIALAAATVELLQQHGIWAELAEHGCGIEHIHVSDRQQLGMTRLHAQQHGVPALGQVIAAALLNQTLYQACQQQTNVVWHGGARFISTSAERDYRSVVYEQHGDTKQLHTQLLVGADGQRSEVRSQLGIHTTSTDYQQVGIVGILHLQNSLNGWAYERFTDTGPIALLPMTNNRASLVWSVSPADAEQLQHADEASFVRRCQQAFGYRAGLFTGIEQRAQYPLQLHLAEHSIAHRALLIGNASHTLHPIAGQGFNLGVRDAIALRDTLSAGTAAAVSATAAAGVGAGADTGVDAGPDAGADARSDAGSYANVAAYWQRREADYRAIIGLTDGLVRGFSNQLWPLTAVRSLALLGLDHVAPLRNQFARQTMGFK